MSFPPSGPENGLIQLIYQRVRSALRMRWVAWRRPKFGQPLSSVLEKHVPDERPRGQLSLFMGSRQADAGADAADSMEVHVETSVPGRLWRWDGDGWSLLALIGVLVAIVMRLYRIDSLQAEMYGDIEIVQTYVRAVLAGEWPWYYALSSGPLYHYVIAPVLWVLGDGYDQIKIASILVSLLIVGLTYVTAYQLLDRRFAAWSVLVAGSGSWLLVFSRLGNSQIFVPLLVIASMCGLVMYLRTARMGWLVVSGATAALGLYSYPQAFVIAPVMWLTVAALWQTRVIRQRRDMGVYALAIVVVALPFLVMYIRDSTAITGDYISEKIADIDNPLGNAGEILLRGIGAYFIQGDEVFRSNPRFLPHIDTLSSLLLLVGIGYWLQADRRAWAPLLLVPTLLLHIPSFLVLRYPDQVPSASRTLGVAPLMYLLVATGWYAVYQRAHARWPRVVLVACTLLVGVSVLQNSNRYFGTYISGMPYGDVPIGREIVRYAEMLSPDTTVYVSGCCWQDGIPEPFFSQIQMQNPERLQRFDPADTLTCEALQSVPRPAVFIWSFMEALPSPNVAACADEFLPVLHTTRDGVPLFYASAVSGVAVPRLALDSLPVIDEMDMGSLTLVPQANDAVVSINGVTTGVQTSLLDTGSVEDMFDDNPESLIKGDNQNPFIIDMLFDTPLTTSAVRMHLAGMKDFVVEAIVVDTAGVMSEYTMEYPNADPDQRVDITFPEPVPMDTLTIRIREQNVPEDVLVYIHVRTLELVP